MYVYSIVCAGVLQEVMCLRTLRVIKGFAIPQLVDVRHHDCNKIFFFF